MQSKADIARDYAVRYRADLESGTISKKQLARVMMRENPGVWDELEHARGVLRSVTGAAGNGTESRRERHAYEFKSSIAHGLLSMPKSEQKDVEDFVIGGPIKIGLLSDLHIPYQHNEAILAATDYLLAQGIQDLYINGDLIDCHKCSSVLHHPDSADLRDELDRVTQFFAWFRERFKGRIIWKFGNHEARLETYLMAKAPELWGCPGMSLAAMTSADDYGIEVVASNQLAKLGKLNVIHGHEFKQGIAAPVNPARGLFLRTKCSSICGHSHATSEHAESNLNGDEIGCWSTGCLCELKPAYNPFGFTRWNHGFAVVEVAEDGDFKVRNRRIIGGRVH